MRELRKWVCIKNQAKRGKEGKLKANVPNIQRIPHTHQECHCQKGVQRGLTAPDLLCEKSEAAHDGSAHHCCISTNKNCIKNNPDYGQERATPRTDKSAEKCNEQTGDDADVEAGDGNNVGSASILERLL